MVLRQAWEIPVKFPSASLDSENFLRIHCFSPNEKDGLRDFRNNDFNQPKAGGIFQAERRLREGTAPVKKENRDPRDAPSSRGRLHRAPTMTVPWPPAGGKVESSWVTLSKARLAAWDPPPLQTGALSLF